MKRLLRLSVLSFLLVLAACVQTRARPGKTVFETLQEKANAASAAGGIAAVGIGEAESLNKALDRAKNRARAEIARMVEIKIDNLHKDFLAEIGEDEGSAFNALFTNACKLLISRILRSGVPRALKYEKKGATAIGYALIVVDPKDIADAFAQHDETQRRLYTRFRASQAFEQLDKEIRKFSEYKRRTGLVRPAPSHKSPRIPPSHEVQPGG